MNTHRGQCSHRPLGIVPAHAQGLLVGGGGVAVGLEERSCWTETMRVGKLKSNVVTLKILAVQNSQSLGQIY